MPQMPLPTKNDTKHHSTTNLTRPRPPSLFRPTPYTIKVNRQQHALFSSSTNKKSSKIIIYVQFGYSPLPRAYSAHNFPALAMKKTEKQKKVTTIIISVYTFARALLCSSPSVTPIPTGGETSTMGTTPPPVAAASPPATALGRHPSHIPLPPTLDNKFLCIPSRSISRSSTTSSSRSTRARGRRFPQQVLHGRQRRQRRPRGRRRRRSCRRRMRRRSRRGRQPRSRRRFPYAR